MRIALFVLTLATALSAQTPSPSPQDIEPVAAFARLFGVVRYFYPGDAGAAVDWNRFAVHGVARVRRATDTAALETALRDLFTPLGPGIDIGRSLPSSPAIGAVDPTLIAWRYTGPGGISVSPNPYTAGRTNRGAVASPANTTAFTGFAQVIQAGPYRGKTVRLRALVRVANPGAGAAGLLLRVDRADGAPGFFDNMQDRPVQSTDWHEYEIQGPIAADAMSIVGGLLTNGGVTAEYDDFHLAVLDGATWIPIPLQNAGFEDGSSAAPDSWRPLGSAISPRVSVESGGAAEGTRFLRVIAVPAETATALPAARVDGAAPRNAFIDVDLGLGLKARVRLSLTDAEARTTGPGLDTLTAAVASVESPRGRSDIDARLSDVVVAWNVLRHFYPYWTEAGVDWDARLRPQLALAAAALDRGAQHDALRQLVADARDGHGSVGDSASTERRARLPLQFAVIEDRVVVTGSSVPEQVPIGSIVDSLGGRAAAELLDAGMRLSSGTAQWRQARSMVDLQICTRDAGISVGLQPPTGPRREVVVPCDAARPVMEPRPNAVAEREQGIWYVDLTRVTAAELTAALPSLASGKGLVIDMRGYPTDAGILMLRHLIDAPESDLWMHVPRIAGPFGQVESWQSTGWYLQPAAPHLPARRVVLTDGRAISYAESVMGYVKDRKLATIIGGPTAGTNGNIVTFTTPGGFAVTFTGMRVTGHDGRAQHHLVGIAPDIKLDPTLAGVRAGRDELLERALTLLQSP